MLGPTNKHLQIVKELWSLGNSFQFHRKVENYIYFGRRLSGPEVVLRLTNAEKRSAEQLKSELDWQLFLMSQGASAAAPLKSDRGTLVESIDADHQLFHVSVFERAPGHPLFKTEHFTNIVMRTWGKTIAEFHEYTKSYAPPQGVASRPAWTEHLSQEVVSALIRDSESREAHRFREITDVLKSLPQKKHSYGLVHTDLHNGNFLWSDEKLTVFDFDDSCYHWFSYDLAVPLFYLRFRNAEAQEKMDLASAEAAYLEGYKSTIKDLSNQLDLLEMFISYRKLIMYGWCQNQLTLQVLDQAGLTWCRNFLNWVRTESL